MIVDRKSITHDGKQYLVARIEYSDRIEYTAWEPATRDPQGFITGGSHRAVYEDKDKKLWGDISHRCPPKEIEMLTPRSIERVTLEGEYEREGGMLAAKLIYAGFKVAGGAKGRLTVMRDKPVDLKEEKMEDTKTRSPVKPDTDKEKHMEVIKKIVGVADFARLKQLAGLNNVIVKEKDTAGLLKMRLMNAFRSMLTKGTVIVEK